MTRRELRFHDIVPDRREITSIVESSYPGPMRRRSLPCERPVPRRYQRDVAIARRRPQLVAGRLADPLRALDDGVTALTQLGLIRKA